MTIPDKNMVLSIDDVEDLTRFADESFDTDEVDLFEFTGDDESPLTRLKSIILSLDWEISDEILNELIEEVTSLRSIWEGDKVAQVYLQGMEKVGNYLRGEGAYAHPNAIKLLLTLFYNFEKIISSPDISGETITSLLKSDIRKFKVLQFQIGKIKPTSAGSANQQISTTQEKETQKTEYDPLANIEATILGLEWEVTAEGLEQFNRQADELHEHLPDNKSSEILLQGLQALGSYISEEKVHAHPDAFTLLHSFYDGLKILVTDKDIDTEQRREILIDRVSRLNSLKEIIATASTKEPVDMAGDEVDRLLDFAADDNVAEDKPTAVQDIEEEEEEDAIAFLSGDDELDFDHGDQKTTGTINAAMETADEQYPDDILDPDAIQPVSDELADDFIEEELGLSTHFTPALDDVSEETAELSMEDDNLSKEDLEEELELLFGDDKAKDAELEVEDLELSLDDEKSEDDENKDLTPDLEVALADVDQKEEDSLDFGDDLFLSEDDKDKDSVGDEDIITPALAETDEEGGFREDVESAELAEEPTAELEDKLDSFFGVSDDKPDTDKKPAAPSMQQADREPEDTVVSALADAEEDVESGFREETVAAELVEESTGDLQDKLDSFFGSDDEPETEVVSAQESKAAAEEPLAEEIDSFFTEDETSEADHRLAETEPALADADEISGFDEQEAVTGLADSAMGDIDDKLSSFFDEDKKESELKTPTAGTALSSLAAVSSTLSPSPAPDDLKQVAELVAAGKKEKIGANQTVLLTLIDSAVALLSKNPEAAAKNNTIVQELIAGLEDAENPATLTDTVRRYTTWQQNFFDTIISSQKSTVSTIPSPAVEEIDDGITLQVQAGFSQLRETMMKEFDDIRKELKQK
jgi:pilus assembly protein FimV